MSSLEYVRERSEKAVEALKEEDDVRIVAHFPISVGKKENAFKKGFDDSKLQVVTRLRAADVEPIAVVPDEWWDAIVEKTGLLAFDTTKHYTFRLTNEMNSTLSRMKLFMAIATAAVFMTLFVTTACFFAPAGFAWRPIGAALLLGIVPSTGVFLFSGFMIFTDLRIARLLGRTRVIRSLLKVREYGETGVGVSYAFPTPPADVADVLSRAEKAGIAIHVAAEPDAVSFDINPIEYAAEGARARRVAMRAARMADPIVYVRLGSAVAIIAQFGDFPIEKRVIDEVMKA